MDIRLKIEELRKVLKIEEKKKRVAEIEEEMQAEGFWNNQEIANERTKELKNLKTDLITTVPWLEPEIIKEFRSRVEVFL